MTTPSRVPLECEIQEHEDLQTPLESLVAKIKKNNTGFEENLVKAFIKDLKAKAQTGGSFTIKGVDGKEYPIDLPAARTDEIGTVWTFIPRFRSYQKLALFPNDWKVGPVLTGIAGLERHKGGPGETKNLEVLLPHYLDITKTHFRHWPKRDLAEKYLIEPKYAASWKQVKEIVCLSLGHLTHFQNLDWDERKYHQHSRIWYLLVAFIRDSIARLRGIQAADLKVYADDPRYTEYDKEYLAKTFDIEAVDPYEGFTKLTCDSFVVTLSHDFPARQIIAQMPAPVGGLAGMCCRSIESTYTFDSADDARNDEDPSSPWLVDYKEKTHELRLDDKSEKIPFNMCFYLTKVAPEQSEQPQSGGEAS